MPFLRLGFWYASPCSPAQAQDRLARLELRRHRRCGRAGLATRVCVLAARYWRGDDVEQEYLSLAVLAGRGSTRQRALVELVYGQLLMARRRAGAMAHLERGFAEARHLFAPEDYFIVLKRHTLLAQLPPVENGAAEDLEALLTTARVIGRFGGARRPGHDPDDTFG